MYSVANHICMLLQQDSLRKTTPLRPKSCKYDVDKAPPRLRHKNFKLLVACRCHIASSRLHFLVT